MEITTTFESLRMRLDHITNDIAEAKRTIVELNILNKKKAQIAWKNILKSSDKISKIWKGPSSLEEIRNQREKVW